MVVVAIAIIAIGRGTRTHARSSSSRSTGPLPPVSAAAPPNADTQAANCAKLLQQLPVSLDRLKPRIVHTTPDTPYVVAWGDPAVVLSCGAARPAALNPGSTTQFIAGGELSGPFYDVTRRGGDIPANVYTSVDRSPYVAITIPGKYQAADYLPELSRDIATSLPAVCSTNTSEPDVDKLCTRRK